VTDARFTPQEPVHVLTVGAFGQAVADALAELLPDVRQTVVDENQQTTPAIWPIAHVHILAAWRPVPHLYQLCDGISYAWKRPWIATVLEDHLLRVGPVVVPGRGACHTCYEKRLLQHSPRQGLYKALDRYYTDHPASGPQGYLPSFAEIAATRLAQIIAHLDADPSSEAGKLWVLDTLNRQIASPSVIGVHDCPRCGLKRDLATRSYDALRHEVAGILPWGLQKTLYGPTISTELPVPLVVSPAPLAAAHLNGHGGNV
jgi:bacteriocin biosynthesis cyclodehydratase domain-containing protein